MQSGRVSPDALPDEISAISTNKVVIMWGVAAEHLLHKLLAA